MFSVIIPLYNKAPYIEKAIQSVLAQTFQGFELIVIDDGSKDNSLEICRGVLHTPEIKGRMQYAPTIIEQKNAGVSITRNNGVKLARYDYIAFLDADDWWSPTFLEEMKSLIEDFPEGALYASSYYKVKNGKNITAKIGVSADFKRGYFDYIQTYVNSIWMPITSISAVIKKDVFNEMQGFKSTLKLGEDFDLWLRIAMKHKIVFLNKPLAYYNQDVEQQNRATGNLHNPQTHILWNLEYLAEEENQNPNLKQLFDNLRTFSLFSYYLNNKYRELAKIELAKVDWTKQPKSTKRKYELPIWYWKLNFAIRKPLSVCKTFVMKKLKK